MSGMTADTCVSTRPDDGIPLNNIQLLGVRSAQLRGTQNFFQGFGRWVERMSPIARWMPPLRSASLKASTERTTVWS